MRLRYGEGASIEFKQKFEKTINYMNSKNTSWIIAKIERSEKIVYIEPTTENSQCVTPFTVYFETWDQFFKSKTMKDTISSPLIDELIEYVLLSNDTTSSDPDTRMVIKPMVNENYIISIGRNSTKINKKIVWNNHHLDTLIMEIYSILEPPL